MTEFSTWTMTDSLQRKQRTGAKVCVSCGRAIAVTILGLLVALIIPPACAQQTPVDSAHDPHAGMHMDMSMAMSDQTQSNPAQEAVLRKDREESEFNHHLAGSLVILAGLFLLGQDILRQRWPSIRFAWPLCFLLAGMFLLVFSDTELWPFGPQSWWYGLTHNPEDLQHKVFAAILLILGFLEMQRARGILKTAWAAWAFPVLALFGSVLLLFHEHHSGMHGAGHMAVMAHIQAEHLHFAISGCSIGVVKGLSEFPGRWRATLLSAWPLSLIVLGILLMQYTE